MKEFKPKKYSNFLEFNREAENIVEFINNSIENLSDTGKIEYVRRVF